MSAARRRNIRHRSSSLLAFALACAATHPAYAQDADGFRFLGYLRSGFGVAGTGDPQEAFKAPNAGAKYRLGNETEAYIETTFAYGVHAPDDPKALFDTRVTVSYVTPTSNTNNFETTIALREAFVTAKGVWASQEAAVFWAGQRFYDRHDLHMSDYYYRDMSGFGGGLDGVRLGSTARVSLAWLGGSLNTLQPSGTVPPPGSFQLSKNTFDLRVSELPLLGGRTELSADLGLFNGDTVTFEQGPVYVASNTGWATSLLHERKIGPGRNVLAVQYGKGVAADFRAVITSIPGRHYQVGETIDYGELWQLRCVEDLHVEPGGPFSLQAGAVWQETGNGPTTGDRITWTSLGLRPAYHFNRYFSVELEAGWDHTNQRGATAGSLWKLTVAPQITPTAAVLSRPSLRAYVTWARWSDGFVGSVAPVLYATRNGGFAAGVQIETWW